MPPIAVTLRVHRPFGRDTGHGQGLDVDAAPGPELLGRRAASSPQRIIDRYWPAESRNGSYKSLDTLTSSLRFFKGSDVGSCSANWCLTRCAVVSLR